MPWHFEDMGSMESVAGDTGFKGIVAFHAESDLRILGLMVRNLLL